MSRQTICLAIGGCILLTIAAVVVYLVQYRGHQLRIESAIAAVDRSVMDRFGLRDYRAQFYYRTEQRSLSLVQISYFVKRHLYAGYSPTRDETHILSSGTKALTTRLKIRGGVLRQVELTATPECTAAAREWASIAAAAFPRAQIVIKSD